MKIVANALTALSLIGISSCSGSGGFGSSPSDKTSKSAPAEAKPQTPPPESATAAQAKPQIPPPIIGLLSNRFLPIVITKDACPGYLPIMSQFFQSMGALSEGLKSLQSLNSLSAVVSNSVAYDAFVGQAIGVCEGKDISLAGAQIQSVDTTCEGDPATSSFSVYAPPVKICGKTLSQSFVNNSANIASEAVPIPNLAQLRDKNTGTVDIVIGTYYQNSALSADDMLAILSSTFANVPRVSIVYPKSDACKAKLYPKATDRLRMVSAFEKNFFSSSNKTMETLAAKTGGKTYDLCSSDFEGLISDLKARK